MRRSLIVLFISALLGGCIGAGDVATVESQGSAGSAFPRVEGINLQGETLELPRDFRGKLNLVAVAFEREQQAAVDTWIAEVDRLGARYEGLAFYEVPTIYPGSQLFRFWVNNGMRAGIQAIDARERTITVYVDRTAFTEALAVDTMTEIQVLLLDDQGRIAWRATGPATPGTLETLERVLEERTGAPA